LEDHGFFARIGAYGHTNRPVTTREILVVGREQLVVPRHDGTAEDATQRSRGKVQRIMGVSGWARQVVGHSGSLDPQRDLKDGRMPGGPRRDVLFDQVLLGRGEWPIEPIDHVKAVRLRIPFPRLSSRHNGLVAVPSKRYETLLVGPAIG